MGPSILKKRKRDEQPAAKRPKKVRKQKHYSSGSSSSASEDADVDFPAVNLAESDEDVNLAPEASESQPSNAHKKTQKTAIPDQTSSDDSASDSEASLTPSNTKSTPQSKSKSKRNDPDTFANSISTILSSKLTTQKRSDPVLSRSATAKEASESLANSKLEEKAKRKLKEEKREAFEKGRIQNVVLGSSGAAGGVVLDAEGKVEGGLSVSDVQEQEKRLRKTAQRGVVKLFNAVRAAQVKAEEARQKGGSRNRTEERVGEMSRKGFLEMVAAGGGGAGKKMEGKEIEEA